LTVEKWANGKSKGTENCEQRAFSQHQHPPWRPVDEIRYSLGITTY
jgi:hypothetical protein